MNIQYYVEACIKSHSGKHLKWQTKVEDQWEVIETQTAVLFFHKLTHEYIDDLSGDFFSFNSSLIHKPQHASKALALPALGVEVPFVA